MKILIKNGRVVDPANNQDGLADVLVEGAKIARVAAGIKADADKIIEAKGKIVMPALVDMHVHLREPGREDKETIATGTGAALKGGVTSLLAMPNTIPDMDCEENIKLLKGLVEKSAQARVYIAGAITKGRQGKELTDLGRLKESGVIAISDDGSSVDNDRLMLEAFKQARQNKLLVVCHCEDKNLSANGVVNLGFMSTKLGLRGISREAEYKRVERDIRLAEEAGCPVHIAHLSCRESVEIIAKAKKKGIKVSAETAPHYFALSDEAVQDYDTNKKMNPPLRGQDDLRAIIQGLKDGVIDVIASDHAPHTENEKEIEFNYAEFGVVGLETELSAAVTYLIARELLGWTELVRKCSYNPAAILGISKGTLGAGSDADIIVLAPEKEWLVQKENLVSKSRNCAFLGKKLKGVVEYTICGGEIVYSNP